MPPEQQRDALTTLAHAQAQLDALKLRLLARGRPLGCHDETGAETRRRLDRGRDAAGTTRRRSDLRLAQAWTGMRCSPR